MGNQRRDGGHGRGSTGRHYHFVAGLNSGQQSKADLHEMLAEAARNTASAPMEEAPSSEAIVPK